MALLGIKVIELAGLAPAPFCGMILSDFGASVIRVDKRDGGIPVTDCLSNGKSSLSVDLKSTKGQEILRMLCKKSDVLIEPFRSGVMESLDLGPNILLKENPKLIYARLTGYGQKGPMSSKAGHDINYVSMSGLLSLFGRYKEKPTFPINFVADFAGGGLVCALGIMMALFEREKTGLGQVVDCSMVEGAAYVGSWLFRSKNLPVWGNERGKNIFDTGSHFYETYETKDNKFMAVGSLEPQFYSNLMKGLGLSESECPQYEDWDKCKKILTEKFLEKTRDEWTDIFDHLDACVTPVLTTDEAATNKHSVINESFVKNIEGNFSPNVAPKLSRTPATTKCTEPYPEEGQDTEKILKELGFSNVEIKNLEREKIVKIVSSKL